MNSNMENKGDLLKLESSKSVQTFSFVQSNNNACASSGKLPEESKIELDKSTSIITRDEPEEDEVRFTLSEGIRLNLSERVVNRIHSILCSSLQSLKTIKHFVLSTLIPICVVLLEILVSNLIMILSAPIIFLWIFVILLTRQVVYVYLTARYKDRYRLMDGADAAWGSKWYANDNCFMSLYIIQGECDLQKIRKRILTHFIDRTIPGSSGVTEKHYVYEKMRTKIVQKFGFYCWEKHREFDICDHVKLARNDPSLVMTETDVFSEIQSWVDKPLPSNLPQWEIIVVPKLNLTNSVGKKSYYGLIWRINHSIMDGISAVSALQNCIAEAPVPMTIDPLAPKATPWYLQLLLYLQILTLGARSFIKTMITRDFNCFHGPSLTGPKHLTWSKPLKVQTLKQVKNTLNSSTTAVLLSSIGGALKTLAESKGYPVPKEVIGGATCAVIPYDGIGPQNRFTVASFNLAVDEETPQERLIKASSSVKQLGSGAEILKNFNMIRLTGLNPAAWITKLMDSLQATFLLSNVPGPMECYKIFGSDTLVDVTAWNTIKGRTAIGICLLSYGGKLRTGFVVDSAVLPDPKDTAILAESFENEIIKLAYICGIPKELVFDDTFL